MPTPRKNIRPRPTPLTLRNDLGRRIDYIVDTYPPHVAAAVMLAVMNSTGIEEGRVDRFDEAAVTKLREGLTRPMVLNTPVKPGSIEEKDGRPFKDPLPPLKDEFDSLRLKYAPGNTIFDPYLPWAASQLNRLGKRAIRAEQAQFAHGGKFPDTEAAQRWRTLRDEYKKSARDLQNALGMITRWAAEEKVDINRYTLEEAIEEAELWLEEHGEPVEPGEVVYTYPDGWTIQRLRSEKALEDEGEALGHCVGSYCHAVDAEEIIILSLRDAKGRPRVTIEWDTDKRYFRQFKAKGNSLPTAEQTRKFWCFVQDVVYKDPVFLGSFSLYDNVEPEYAYGDVGYAMARADSKFRDDGGVARFVRVNSDDRYYSSADVVFFVTHSGARMQVASIQDFADASPPEEYSDSNKEPYFAIESIREPDVELMNSNVALIMLNAINPPLEGLRDLAEFGSAGDEFVAAMLERKIDPGAVKCTATAANPRRRKNKATKARDPMADLKRKLMR